MKEILNKLLENRYEAILSGKLNDFEIIELLKDIKLILDIRKEIE